MVAKKKTKRIVKKKVVKRKTPKRKYTKKPKTSVFSTPQINTIEEEISKPSAWFRSVQRHEDVINTHMWSVNKEKIYENYHKSFIRYFDANDNEILKKRKDFINATPYNDFVRIMSEEVLVMPNGKIITPIRQYCETKILPRGTNEAFFFDFGSVNIAGITEYAEPQISSPTIKSSSVKTEPRGTRIDVGYQQTESHPIDIIVSVNRSFALESIHDENKQVMNAVNQLKLYAEDVSKGTKIERCLYSLRSKIVELFKKPKRKFSSDNKWVDYSGKFIKDDSHMCDPKKEKITIKAVLKAKGVIQYEGLDDSNLILYTSSKAIRDLTLDPEIDKYVGHSRPAIITEATVERILGVNLVRDTSSIPRTSTKTVNKPENVLQKIVRVFWGRKRETIEINGAGYRSVLFIPNVAFGIVSGRDLTMEAQRRNELQAVSITGTQKIAGLVKNKEAICRISHM